VDVNTADRGEREQKCYVKGNRDLSNGKKKHWISKGSAIRIPSNSVVAWAGTREMVPSPPTSGKTPFGKAWARSLSQRKKVKKLGNTHAIREDPNHHFAGSPPGLIGEEEASTQ